MTTMQATRTRPLRVAVLGDYPENPPTLVGGIQAVMYYTLAALKQPAGPARAHGVSIEREEVGHGGAFLSRSPGLQHLWTRLLLRRGASCRDA